MLDLQVTKIQLQFKANLFIYYKLFLVRKCFEQTLDYFMFDLRDSLNLLFKIIKNNKVTFNLTIKIFLIFFISQN